MFSHLIATTIDYNRGLPTPVLWVHAGIAALRPVADALLGWTLRPACRSWAPLLVFTVAAVWFAWPRDGAVSAAARAWFESGGGDLRRELAALQQFGQGFSMVVLALVILLLDPDRRARLLDWGVGALLTLAACVGIKWLIGRPRPNLGDAESIVGPLGAYAVEKGGAAGEAATVKLATVWNSGYDLASMPSRHAAFAVLAAVFLSALYPRLWWVVFGLAVLVCVGRVVTGAHYPTDVIAGAGLGLLVGRHAVGLEWGQRLVSRLARR